MLTFDTETCGYHGPIILLQFAIDDGPIFLHEVWREPIEVTLGLIEQITKQDIVGFNLAFDWFHICQLYTTLRLCSNPHCPPDIDEYALMEPSGRMGPCLKPKSALDLMLFARKGPYQSTMARKPIAIRRVPAELAPYVVAELEKRIHFRDIFFARANGEIRKGSKWKIYPTNKPELVDIVLKFHASTALKALAADRFNRVDGERFLYKDVSLPKSMQPREKGYAPFALAVGKPGRWNKAWPEVIKYHIAHWQTNEDARKYAEMDVADTRNLHKSFLEEGPVPFGDDDSELACMVGAVRWKGYKLDIPGIIENRKKALEVSRKAPRDSKRSRNYIMEVLSPVEQLGFQKSTAKQVLEYMATSDEWQIECDECNGQGTIIPKALIHVARGTQAYQEHTGTEYQCQKCAGTGQVKHPAALRAIEVLEARSAKKEVELYDKLLEAGRFHASLVVIGTLSSRMSGSDGLNPQAINNDPHVRKHFLLADEDRDLSAGDFDAFEVTLAESVYKDPKLTEALKSGKSIHGIFGSFCFKKSYDEIMATKKNSVTSGTNLYDRAKKGVFAKIYFGTTYTLEKRIGIPAAQAEQANEMFENEYPDVRKARKRIENMFGSMQQPRMYGPVIWNEPKEYIETMFGDRRYFTLENEVCRVLYQLATNPTPEIAKLKFKIVRRERVQTAAGATQSALFGAAFQIQSKNVRAAGNHEIQSSGARITKHTQRRIWDHQPSGICEWIVQPVNIHDEILCPAHRDHIEAVKATVNETVESYRSKVPLIGMTWKTGLRSWADK